MPNVRRDKEGGKMKVYQIFSSIDGEVNAFHQGALSVFVRLAGCNLNCSFCDTRYARGFDCGKDMPIDAVLKEIKRHGIKKVTITGGEPLLQQDEVNLLCRGLLDTHCISIETNGSIIPDLIHKDVSYVLDFKLEGSGMMDRMNYPAFENLRPIDFVKFVISDEKDYLTAHNIIKTLKWKGCRAIMAFSPLMAIGRSPGLNPDDLIRWMKEFPVDWAVLNVQLHKVLNLLEPTELMEVKGKIF